MCQCFHTLYVQGNYQFTSVGTKLICIIEWFGSFLLEAKLIVILVLQNQDNPHKGTVK